MVPNIKNIAKHAMSAPSRLGFDAYCDNPTLAVSRNPNFHNCELNMVPIKMVQLGSKGTNRNKLKVISKVPLPESN